MAVEQVITPVKGRVLFGQKRIIIPIQVAFQLCRLDIQAILVVFIVLVLLLNFGPLLMIPKVIVLGKIKMDINTFHMYGYWQLLLIKYFAKVLGKLDILFAVLGIENFQFSSTFVCL